MNLECVNCEQTFEATRFRGYCDTCIEGFGKQREHIHKRQRPGPGIIADGKFAIVSPQSVYDPVAQANVCGLCGSPEIEMGYGLGSGYGMGSYNFCGECNNFLDFSEDLG